MKILLILFSVILSKKTEDHIENEENEESLFSKEWDDHIKNFGIENLLTFEIGALSEDDFFENIENVPSKINGAWFVSNTDSKDIEFIVLDPNSEVILTVNGEKEKIFSINAITQGNYIFRFKNSRMLGSNSITFVLNSDTSDERLVTTENLTPIESKINTIHKNIKDFQLDNQFAQLRQTKHYDTVATSNSNVFWFSILESLGVFAVTGWQIFYIKKLLDNRRVL